MESADSAMENPLPQAPSHGQPPPLKWLALAIGTILLMLWLWRTFFGDFTPPLTKSAFETAQQQWKSTRATHYNLRLELKTTKLEVVDVEVRDDQPTSVKLNGIAITQRRTMETWTVPGMLTTIAEDLDHLQAARMGQATPQTPRLRLWCQFDPVTGVPTRYRRLEWDKAHEIVWVVTKFERVEK